MFLEKQRLNNANLYYYCCCCYSINMPSKKNVNIEF